MRAAPISQRAFVWFVVLAASMTSSVVVASRERPLPAISLAEVLATSDLPRGVVNLLTGHADELAPVLGSHMDVNAIDLVGVAGDERGDLEVAAAENVKRVLPAPAQEPDWTADPGPATCSPHLRSRRSGIRSASDRDTQAIAGGSRRTQRAPSHCRNPQSSTLTIHRGGVCSSRPRRDAVH